MNLGEISDARRGTIQDGGINVAKHEAKAGQRYIISTTVWEMADCAF